FVVYGRASHLVDLSEVKIAKREFELLSPAEVNLRIRSALGRKLVVVGATIGTDAHTVGIDAILNVKGHAGEKGLEYYREIKVVNLGSQVEVPRMVAIAAAEGADAVLISGGPRFDPQMAAELGVDKIFGKGTTPRDVASYLVHMLAPAAPGAGRP